MGRRTTENPADRDKLAAAGITPLALDMANPDFSRLQTISTTSSMRPSTPVSTTGHGVSRRNAHNSGLLLHHCPIVKGFVFCSTGSIYGYQGRDRCANPIRGVPLRPNYSFSKIAAESVCTWVAQRYGIPCEPSSVSAPPTPGGWRTGGPP